MQETHTSRWNFFNSWVPFVFGGALRIRILGVGGKDLETGRRTISVRCKVQTDFMFRTLEPFVKKDIAAKALSYA